MAAYREVAIAANLAGKARDNADREHRPELVLAALAATEVGDLPQFIQKARQGLRRGLHFGPLYLPVRIRLLRAESGTGRRRQRVDKHLLRLPVRVGVAASAAGIALGTAHIGPVSGNIHRPLMPPGVNKRFGEFQRVPPPLVPVTAQSAQHSRHHATRQVRKLPGVPQNQKTRIARNKMQPLKLLRTRPADEAVARSTLQRADLPTRQGNPKAAQQRNVAQSPARKAMKAKFMPFVHHPVPANPLIRTRKANLDIAHRNIRRKSIHGPVLARRA